MDIQAERLRYFNIDGSNINSAKQIESEQLQTAVEAFKAEGGKIEIIPMGMSKYLTELQKSRLKKKFGKRMYQ